MTIEQIIKKAIEGGWDKTEMQIEDDQSQTIDIWELSFLDPKVWEALGKSFGWNKYESWMRCINCGGVLDENNWLYQWHKFIDHLANGKSAESFFEKF